MEKKSQKKQMEEIYSIVRDVLKEWWVVLCIAISAAFLSYIASSATYQPVYTSSTTFVVSAKGSNTGAYANLSKTQKLAETFRSVMDSQVLKKMVADSLDMESFPGTVEMNILPETNLLTVSVKSSSPDVSFKLLNSMLENYPSVAENVLGEVVLEIFEEPNYPTAPINPYNGSGTMKKAFVLAAIVMLGMFAVLSYLEDSVKVEEDITEKLDTTLFGTTEHEFPYRNLKAMLKRNKKRILLNEPSVGFAFAENVKKMRTKILYQCEKEGSKVIFITSTLRKEGKTTIAANLALSLATRGKRVLLIEGDLRKADLASTLGVEIPEGSGIMDISNKEMGLKKQTFKVPDKPLYLLANIKPQVRSTEFLESQKFSSYIADMREKMDFIIIDGPSAKGRADAEVLAKKSDVSLLVVKQSLTKVPYINDTIDMLNAYGKGVLGAVFNDVYSSKQIISSGYGYGYGYGYGKYSYGKYGLYGKYGHYGIYGRYGVKGAKDE